MESYFATTQAGKNYCWVHYIVNGLLPYSFIEESFVCNNLKHESIFLNTFMKYVPLPTELDERKISALLRNNLALIFDG